MKKIILLGIIINLTTSCSKDEEKDCNCGKMISYDEVNRIVEVENYCTGEITKHLFYTWIPNGKYCNIKN
jgi:hypothetical protein